MVNMILLSIPALGLTVAMFATRQMMLGFPSAIFWGIFGGYAYLQSSSTWDWQYILFFSCMGMVIFSMFAAYALRKKDLSGPDRDAGAVYIDEKKSRSTGQAGEENRSWGDIDSLSMSDLEDKESETASRKRIQERAAKRKRKANWGEFG
jgi:hypothetical protein